jgi:hypothetical protein
LQPSAEHLEKVVEDLQNKYQDSRLKARLAAGILNSANNTPAQASMSPSTPAMKKPVPEVSPRFVYKFNPSWSGVIIEK